MKKIAAVLTAFLLTASLAGCGAKEAPAEEAPVSDNETQQETAAEETEIPSVQPETDSGKKLVVYFSCTGHTKDIAEKIADLTGADLYEIKAAQEYTSDDLNWHDENSRTTHEQNDPDARPEIGSEPLSLEGYDTIYIGHPIWWGEQPRIMDTFVESYDFGDITMIPFCTSASSPAGNSGKNLAEHAGTGNWLDATRFAPGTSAEELREWIGSLKQ